MNKKINYRIGEINISKSNLPMKIIRYNGCDDITVEFEDGYKTDTTYGNFKKGEIKHPCVVSVYGIGYLGEGETDRKSYDFWHGMLKRCYSKNDRDIVKYSSYRDKNVSVHKDWYNYQNFKKWFDDNYYKIEGERMELDKDILIKGNKIYCSETCVFVPQRINKLFTKGETNRGKSLIGTWKTYNNKYICQADNKTYDNEMEAFFKYKSFKENIIKNIANEYKQKYSNFPNKLYDAMYSYQVERTD